VFIIIADRLELEQAESSLCLLAAGVGLCLLCAVAVGRGVR